MKQGADTAASGSMHTAATVSLSVVAVMQLEGKEQAVRTSARQAGFLPFIITNADIGDPAWDTPAFTLRRRSECAPGSSGSPGRSVPIIHRSTVRLLSLRAATRRSRGKEDKEVFI